MNLVQAAELPKATKEFRAFCNSLRCPLCGSQLDGNIHPKRAELYCCLANKEYSGVWFPDNEEPREETITHWFSEHEYQMTAVKVSQGLFRVKIVRYNRGVNPLYKNVGAKEVFDYTGPRIPFFRQRLEEKQFLDKLSLYNWYS